jgi:hypothetical protein
MNLQQENDLLLLSKRHNSVAFGKFYDKYAGAVFGIILKEIANTNDAGKILQDVFLTFNRTLKTRQCISEGVFICLNRITRKAIYNQLTSVQNTFAN